MTDRGLAKWRIDDSVRRNSSDVSSGDALAGQGCGVSWPRRNRLGVQRAAAWPNVRPHDLVDDGHILFDAVVEHGLEGIVAKRRSGIYRSGYRGWTKIKSRPSPQPLRRT